MSEGEQCEHNTSHNRQENQEFEFSEMAPGKGSGISQSFVAEDCFPIFNSLIPERENLDEQIERKLDSWMQQLANPKQNDKSKEGVCPEVRKDTENELISYLQHLKEQFQRLDFGLDNSEKLLEAVQILQKVEKLKTLEAAIPSLVPIRKEINKSFDQSILPILQITLQTINKWRRLYQQRSERYITVSESLDLKIAEKILKFLENSTVKKIIPKEISELLLGMNEIITNYGKLMRKEMNESFHEIETSEQPKEALENLDQNVKVIVFNLDFMIEASEKYLRTYNLLESDKKLLDEWRKRLKRYLNDLSNDMRILNAINDNPMLIHKLTVARALSQCDEFLDPTSQFLRVYREFQEKYVEETRKNETKILELIKAKSYREVLYAIKDMEDTKDIISQSTIKRLRREINTSIFQLLEETEVIAKCTLRPVNLNYETILAFDQNLSKVEKSQLLLKDYLENIDVINTRLIEMKNTVSKSLTNFISRIKKKIENYYFTEAKRDQDQIQEMIIIYSFDEPVLDEYRQLNLLEKEMIEKLKKIYQELPIDQYFSRSPKEIFARLMDEEAAQKNSQNIIYEDLIWEIENIVLLKFREELNQARCRENFLTIRKYKSALKFLPERLCLVLQEELGYFLEEQNSGFSNF